MTKGDETAGCLTASVMLGGAILAINHFVIGKEREGFADMSKCVEQIDVSDDPIYRMFHDFTCSTQKSKTG